MKYPASRPWLRFFVLFVVATTLQSARADVSLVVDGEPKAAIFVPDRIWDDAVANPEQINIWSTLDAEANRRRLRESVKDMVGIIQRMTGATLSVEVGLPQAGDTRTAILIGEYANDKFGAPQDKHPYEQGLRIVIDNDNSIGLGGESDLATSYAIYTLLDQLGCRWFMPSAMGEVLPETKTITLKSQDVSTGPYTYYRGLWYCDNDFGRRNRLGGMAIAAGHSLEIMVTDEFRKEHPEIRAIIKGEPHDHWVKWTHPLVAEAVIKGCMESMKQYPDQKSLSLSPNDGATWDESDDTKYDAGDFDEALQTVAKADRLMVLCNRVAEAVTKVYPDMKFGVLAYVDYTRPPVREKPHPAIVPQIAPIIFSRAQPMDDLGEPNNASVRHIVEGWGKLVPATSYYFYGYNLAEVSSPNPMITKWGHDIPYIYEKGACRYWQPETITNFETSMHAHWLGLRMAWDPSQKPAEIIDEINTTFYGHAAEPMAAYWNFIDKTWVDTPEYAGCGFGHLRRWNLKNMTKARRLMDAGIAACQTDDEKTRVDMANESLKLFEMFMKQRRDLAEGNWKLLDEQVKEYRQKLIEVGEKYQPQFAFSRMGWTGENTLTVRYSDYFYGVTHTDAARIRNEHTLLVAPMKNWKFQPDKEKQGEADGWFKPEFDDSSWRSTNCVVDTWSSLGLHNYMGSAWYRMNVKVLDVPPGKKIKLWIGSTDGRVKVYINDRHIPYVDDKGETTESVSGFCQPFTFDITSALKPEENNTIALYCTREVVNELGTGGLLAPAAIYAE
ncbi:MAG: DUF4838 domain-containing protein [Planctomycetota bacterium]|nr:DUF4838 domain-containing protein [Planctomycetota bacterium]